MIRNSTKHFFSVRNAVLMVLLALLCPWAAKAQPATSYGYTAFSGTYEPLTGGTAAAILGDDVTATGIAITFPFVFCGTSYNTLSACSNGFISLANSTATSFTNSQANIGSAGWLMPYWDDGYGSTTGGSAKYQITGTAPNRVFTFEWKNWGFCCSTTPYHSFQVKLFETTNVIQFLYSPTTQTARTATIGIANSTSDWKVLNNATATAVPVVPPATFVDGIAAQPASGQVYQFTPPVPCSGVPNGTVTIPTVVCPNTAFNFTVNSTPPATGLTYQWEKSLNGTTGWTPVATTQTASDNITVATYYRVKITCTNTNNVYTSPAYLVTIGTFYYCYCAGGGTYTTYTNNIGNVTILKQPSGDTVLNNGIATPLQNNPNAGNLYTSFVFSIPPKQLYLDSTYKIYVTEINTNGFYTCTATAFIDYNHNGVFDPATERLFSAITATPSQQVNGNFTIPSNSMTGITGLRVILNQTTSTVNPCGSFNYGEVEDYLVNVNYPPCNGAVSAGIAKTTDTAMCLNYYFTLTDTTHESHKSGIVWLWQQSVTNGNTWTDVANSTGKDTITRLFTGAAWYRLRMICTNTNDTSYSNVVKVSLKPPYKCYCYSIATGGVNNDTTDIGSFSIGKFVATTGGPHLLNPEAKMGRTDYTDLGPIELFIDSTYEVNVYQILKNAYHGDARVTLFMDFNNNLQYDIPQEAIYLTTPNPSTDWKTTSSNWYLINSIKIPHAAIPNVPTGMRVIINSDVAPNTPSETACGPYISGETEDYTIMFRVGYPQGVAEISGLENLSLFPNPTGGQFTVSFTAQSQLKDVAINVTDVTGRTISRQTYGDVSGGFKAALNLTEQARGVYFVEIKANDQKIVKRVVLK